MNGKKVNIGSYIVKEEDTIEIRDKSKQLAIIDIALASKEREAPEYRIRLGGKADLVGI